MNAAAVASAITRQAAGRLPELWISAWLFVLTAEDLRTRSISLPPLVVLAGSGIAARLFLPQLSIRLYAAPPALTEPAALSFAAALLPGVLLLVTGWLSRGAVGYGDGLLVAALGIWLSPFAVWSLLMGGLVCSFVTAIALLLRRHSRKTAFPFVPMLAVSWVFGLFVEAYSI